MTTQHIGAAGELLVQYLLLKNEIDSARMTTDSGVDLVAYSPVRELATTIQVKTVRQPGTAGGKVGGPPNVGWWFPREGKAELLALALLSQNSVWIFHYAEAVELAQQNNARGNCQLYWFTDAEHMPAGARFVNDMDRYLLENRVDELLLTTDPREEPDDRSR